jgi:predicted alpha/beta hydrolase family esterase
MKRAIIIHGWGSNGNDWWFAKEKKILEGKGYKVENPTMPNTLMPQKEIWLKILDDFKPDEETILIGHSLGCPTILRYLEKSKKTVNKVFLIAPFAKDLGIDFVPIKNFVDKPFDWQTIRMNALDFYVVTQEGDAWTPVEYGIEVANKTGANLTIVKGDDHLQESLDLDLINSNL